MSATVFANGMSICWKGSSGKTTAAMPDVCLSPPSPPAGPIPIPYPNTSSASDTDKGSTTVLIGGDPVALKDRSIFKTSTGNEAATRNLGMGVVTHKIQGEAQFIAWSMDVKFEGENVPRHMDLMGHNEACSPSQTPPWLYAHESALQGGGEDPCKDVQDAIKNDCKPGEFNQGSPGCSEDCCKAKKCVLSPYGRVPACCDGKTKHHVIPDHCFKAPGKGDYYPGVKEMSYSAGLAVCVSGEDKDDSDSQTGQLLTHGEIHRDFDRIENWYRDNNSHKWSFEEANEVAGDVVAFHTDCDSKCLKQQTKQYYGDKGVNSKSVLRADANLGRVKPPAEEMGDLQAGWKQRYG